MIEFWTASAKPLQRLSSAAAAVDAAAGHDRYHDLVAIVIVMPPDGVEEAHCCRPQHHYRTFCYDGSASVLR